MPPLPPLKLTLDALASDVLPAAGAGAFVLCLFLVFGRWAGALGSAAAVTVAFMAANFTLSRVGFDEKPNWENTARLIAWKPAEDPPGWHWLPRAALLLVVVGLVSRWLGPLVTRLLPERAWWVANLLVWLPRLAAVLVVSEWLASGRAASTPEWAGLGYRLAAMMFAVWVALDGVARAGAAGQVAAYQAAMLLTAGVILLYTHNARFMEMAVVLGCALFGIAVAAGVGKADASGAIPATVAFLPGLMFAVRPSLADHKVPVLCFWLVTLAPLALTPFLIPALSRKTGWVAGVIRAVLVLAPLAAAVALAAQHEVVAFDEE